MSRKMYIPYSIFLNFLSNSVKNTLPMKIFRHHEISNSDLIIDAIYEGGNKGNTGDDPISKILKVGNQGGFRYAGKFDDLKYIALYTSGEDVDWPDTINNETGIFKYFGDNKLPGNELHDTNKKGNLILKNLFDSLYSQIKPRTKVPPIFIFKKHPTPNSNRSVQFKGLCVPGTLQRNNVENLIAIWKTSNGLRFQNYVAYFTILDIGRVNRKWLNDLNTGKLNSPFTPEVFVDWKKNGTYKALISPKTVKIRSITEQLPTNDHENKMLKYLHQSFENNPVKFEYVAAEIFRLTNPDIIIDEITQSTMDGGRDAMGRMKIGLNEDPIYTEFALEAKCYNPGLNKKKINTVGVKEVSRLISRIRNRQFGVLVTTSAISRQAYKEVRLDNHPIIFISGKDIIKILIDKGINSVKSIDNFIKGITNSID